MPQSPPTLDDGLQIVNVTDPENPSGIGQLQDNNSTLLDAPSGVDTFTIGASIYAAVTSYAEDGLQLVNITDPASPRAAGYLNDTSLPLDGPRGVDVFTIGAGAYAVVASSNDDSLQLVNITDPASPQAAGYLNNTGLLLDAAFDVAVFKIDSHAYAAVAAANDNGLQLVNITDPFTLRAAGSLEDDGARLLASVRSVDTFALGQRAYAVLSSPDDNGLQMVDVTDPANPRAVGSLEDDSSLLLGGSGAVDTFMIGESIYAAVISDRDGGLQLARLAIEPVQDLIGPIFASASLDHSTRVLTITFSEVIDISTANLNLLNVRDAGQTNQIRLAGAAFDRNAADSDTMSMNLTTSQLNRIIRMSAPQLDIQAGAVSDP